MDASSDKQSSNRDSLNPAPLLHYDGCGKSAEVLASKYSSVTYQKYF